MSIDTSTSLDHESSVHLAEQLSQLAGRVETLEGKIDEDKLVLGVMSGTFDATMAAFIIALGAAASDMEVDMFFAFWATAALRDPKKRVSKGMLDKMFGWMLPSSSRKLPLSQMQMAGIGPRMIRGVMKSHNVPSLEKLMQDAGELGIRIHVCTMSMDVMGLKQEEFIDYPNIDYVGVGSLIGMMDRARQCFFL